MKKLITFFACILALGFFLRYQSVNRLPAGVEYSPDSPIQENIAIWNREDIVHYKYPDVIIKPFAKYDITAKVLSKKEYKRDSIGDNISPVDFALGWGKLSDEFYATHKGISFSQRNRWYFYSWKDDYPLSSGYISVHSANTHIIPANDFVKKQALNIKKGSIIKMQGYLVNVRNSKNSRWKWDSSSTRLDTGDKSCEVFYVENIEVIAD